MLYLKQIVTAIVPQEVLFYVRKQVILRQHKRVGKICDNLIGKHDNGHCLHFPVKAKKAFANERIIWQYWAQGYDHLPEMVQICLRSVERYKRDYQLVRLTDDNISDYIEIPVEIQQKRGAFADAHFSDLLRCALLATYGGVWLDATILLTGPLPESYFTHDFFMFQRDANAPHKREWERNFSHYWGWYDGFKVNVFNSVIYAKRGCGVIHAMCDMLYDFWMDNEKMPNYFFFQILFNEYISKYPALNCKIVSDCLPHYATQSILDNFMSMSFHEALDLSTIHKASYKMSETDIASLKSQLQYIGGL